MKQVANAESNFDYELQPYEKMWVSAIRQAILDLTSRNESIRYEARQWFTDGRTDSGSFKWVCSTVFDISPDAILRPLRAEGLL